MNRILLIIILFLNLPKSYSQNEIDALRYSFQDIIGSSKFSSMSGSFGALGGDFSSTSNNPAGIGMYQFSELSFTSSYNLNRNNNYFSTRSSDLNSFFDGQLGIIYTELKNKSDWKRVNFGIGWNSLANYENKLFINGNNNSSSLADVILIRAQGKTINSLNPFDTELAFWSDLIDLSDNSIDTSTNYYANDNGNYISHVNGRSLKNQSRTLSSSGGLNEFILSIASSYKEYLYLGLTIGLPIIDYNERLEHFENNFNDTVNGLNSFSYNHNLTVSCTP